MLPDDSYQQLSLNELQSFLRRAKVPVFRAGRRSGFEVLSREGHDTYLGLTWRNTEGENHNHKDLAAKLSSVLRKEGYEVKSRKPTGTMLSVRRPKNFGIIAEIGFEALVESLCGI